MNLLFRIIGLVILALGAFVVYGGKIFVKKFDLASKQKIDLEGIEEDKLKELQEYKALAFVKVIGAVIFLGGLVITVLAFN